MNQNTASAAESVIAGLKQIPSILVGKKTFGKGASVFSKSFKNEKNPESSFTLTYTVDQAQEWKEFEGITPDIEIPENMETKEGWEQFESLILRLQKLQLIQKFSDFGKTKDETAQKAFIEDLKIQSDFSSDDLLLLTEILLYQGK